MLSFNDEPHKIFDGNPGESVPDSFNSCKIMLDGRLSSDLDWKHARQQALEAIEQGLKVFWEIDLGFYVGLTLPLSNQMQHTSLGLALDHFRDTLWKEFQPSTIGLCLYRGSADFSLGFPWDEAHQSNAEWSKQERRLYCRDLLMDYLNLLVANLPDAMPRYLLLDVSSLEEWEAIQLINHDVFARWHCAIKDREARLPLTDIAWDVGASPYGFIGHTHLPISKQEIPQTALCLPPDEMQQTSEPEQLKNAIKSLKDHGIPFRIIPETVLITEWDGLDYLVVLPEGLSPQGIRKLNGFCAAGGTVVSLGRKVGMPIEISFDEFLNREKR